MAMRIDSLLAYTCADACTRARLVDVLIGEDITSAYKFAKLEAADIVEVAQPQDQEMALAALKYAKEVSKGYHKIPNVIADRESVIDAAVSHRRKLAALAPTRSFKSRCMSSGVCSSVRSAKRAFTSFTKRLAFGRPKLCRGAPTTGAASISLEEKESMMIEKAVKPTHAVFVAEASQCPRMRSIEAGGELLLLMQMDVYKMGFRSARVIGGKSRLAQGFFDDLKVLRWQVLDLDAFRVAAWARGRVVGASVSAARKAKQTLLLVSAALDIDLFLENSIVKAQLGSCTAGKSHEEPPTAAECIDFEFIIKLEGLVRTAETPQLRCFAGYFALLACVSLWALDAIRTGSVEVVGDSISGVSRMKSKLSWTRWYAPLVGYSGHDWATEWIRELAVNGLPETDYLLFGVNTAGDKWMQRPASYADARRMLHLLLMAHGGLSAEQAVKYNPHGFRHVMITSAQQLKQFGVVQDADLNVVGQWAKGSKMPMAYDSAAGVTEMRVREAVMDQIRMGWRPVENGSLPRPPIAKAPKPTLVGHRKRRCVHVAVEGSRVTMC